MSENAVVIVTGTGSKDGGCLQSVGWLESSCSFFQLCKARLTCMHSLFITKYVVVMGSCINFLNMGSRLVGW